MKFECTPYKLVGSPNDNGWVSVYDFTPVNKELADSKGRLIGIISVSGKSVSSGNEELMGKEIFNSIQNAYFSSQNDLKTSIENVTNDFKNLEITMVAVKENEITIAGIGKNECWVLRGGKLARLIGQTSKIDSKAGYLESGDLFFLGTHTFFENVTPEVLKSPETIKSLKITPSGDLGAVIIKINKIEDNMPPMVIPIEKENIGVTKIKTISPIRLAVASVIDRIINILPSPDVYIKEDLGQVKSNKKKKIATSAGAILLLLLIVSIIFGTRKQKIANSEAKYAGILASIQHDLDEAKSISSVDPIQARSLVLDANNQVQSLLNQKIKDPKVTSLAEDVQNAMGTIAGFYTQAPSLYLDLTLISSGFKGTDMAASDSRMVVLDSVGKRLESIDIPTGGGTPVAGPDVMPNANLVAAYSDRNFVSANDGIWDVGDKAENIIKKDWGDNILISAYTGNFYLLDKNSSIVWRYQGDGGVFGTKSNWFGAGVKPDLSNAISWTIDGNIWILTTNGDILRFSAGSPVNFTIQDLDKALNAKDIFTTQDSKYLYVLDSGNGRILVINKDDGTIKVQYTGDNIKNASKIVVSEPDKKMILLEGSSLYSLDIKHL